MKLNSNVKDKQGEFVYIKIGENYTAQNTGKIQVLREGKIKDNQRRFNKFQ